MPFCNRQPVRYHSSDVTEFNANIWDRLNYCLTECTMVASFHMDNPNEMRFAMNTSYCIQYAMIFDISWFICCYVTGWLLKTSASAE